MNNSDVKNLFGQRIKILRKKRNLTQSNIAEMVDVDAKHISCIENGKNFPSPELIAKLANAFNLHVKELFEFENPPTSIDFKKEIVKTLDTASDEEIERIFNFTKFISG
ncbi:MAG: helix-turn-helix transcriptional regulator [Candidatus Gastranaerophilaceae bacterium]